MFEKFSLKIMQWDNYTNEMALVHFCCDKYKWIYEDEGVMQLHKGVLGDSCLDCLR